MLGAVPTPTPTPTPNPKQGNDQTELNRLLTNRYRDGDWACNDPRCVLPRPYQFVPVAVDFVGAGCDQGKG